MDKEKREHKNKFDIKQMMKEREDFYRGLSEIEELKKSLSEMVAEDEAREREEALMEEATKTKVLSTLRIIGDKPPGREVLFPANYCQRFDEGKIEKLQLPNGLTYQLLRKFLENRIQVNHAITSKALFRLFLLMSLDQDEAVIESCYQLLKNNVNTFTLKFHHIIDVFLNWGATLESLNVHEGEKAEVFPKGIRTKTPNADFEFCLFNYTKVFDYVGEVCLLNLQCYSKTEKTILLKCLFRLSLDKSFSMISVSISTCISRVIESFLKWDSSTVVNLCQLIHDENDHFHNQVAVVMDTLPQIKRCNDLLSCIYYFVFRSLAQLQPKNYKFPYEDEEIVELVKAIQVDPNKSDDLYRLYVSVQLLNFIVHHGKIYNNRNALKEIIGKMQQLKCVVSSSSLFDAIFVNARMMYCCGIWPLSQQKNRKPELFY